VKAVPLNRILLETDGPYMAPVPHRGKAAHPGHVPYIAQQVAEVKGVALDEVLRTVRDNTRAVYGI
jgi:TatD DNase family protein